MTQALQDNSQDTSGSSFESLFIRFDGVRGTELTQDLQRDAQNLEIAAGQPWENAIAELREELDLPNERFKLSLYRLNKGQRWKIARSAWRGIKSEEELHLVAEAKVHLSQEDKKPKDEPKPRASSPQPGPAPNPPISPASLAALSSIRRSISTRENSKTPSQEIVVPATPDDSTISDTEDEAMPLDVQGGEDEHDKVETGIEREQDTTEHPSVGGLGASSGLGLAILEAQTLPQFSAGQSYDSANLDALQPPPTSQQSTSTVAERERRRSFSPSPSTKFGILQHQSSFGSPPPVRQRTTSPSRPYIKPPPSSAPSTAALQEEQATPLASWSTSSFPPPAQQIPQPTATGGAAAFQFGDLSDQSFRIGIDSSGQVNFVPASSPRRLAGEQLPQTSTVALQHSSNMLEDEEEDNDGDQPRRLDKGKGRAIDPTTSEEEEEEEVVVRSPRVKREPRTSPRQSGPSANSPSRNDQSSFTVEVVSPLRPSRQLKCRIAPKKKRRLTDSSAAADTSTSTVLTELTSSSQTSSSRLPAASDPPPAASTTCNCSKEQHASPSKRRAAPPRKKGRTSISAKQRKLDEAAAALARPRMEIPRFPSSGRFCLYLRLPNTPSAPRWANAGLRPVYLLKFQGKDGATLGSLLFDVFEYISAQTGWKMQDLRLRHSDPTEEEGSEERDKLAWGFDTIFTQFRSLEEWGIGEQDFIDVDFIRYSPDRKWQDVE